MNSTNFYDVLGIPSNSSDAEIKKKYRSLSMKHHPDRNPGNAEALKKSQEINEAYETLGDAQLRKRYDMSRNNPFVSLSSNHGTDVDINSLFGNLGNLFKQEGMNAFTDTFMSEMKDNGSNLPNIKIFRSGNTTGSHYNNLFKHMPHLRPKPKALIKTIEIDIGKINEPNTIPVSIDRWIIENDMKTNETETIYVNVEQGIDDNEIIMMENKGNIHEQLKGDVKIVIKVINNTNFRRQGLDLFIDQTITLKESLCGFSFELNYINGKNYTVNNTRGNIVSPEYRKTIPKLGITRGNNVGNLIIIFHVEFPSELSNETIGQLLDIL